MNSIPLLDPAAGASLAGLVSFPSPTTSEAPAESFGLILEEATAETQVTEGGPDEAGDADETSVQLAPLVEEDKREEPVMMASFICFCPPPEFQNLQTPPTAGGDSELPEPVEPSESAEVQTGEANSSSVQAAPATDTTELASANLPQSKTETPVAADLKTSPTPSVKRLPEIVEPKVRQAKKETNPAAATSATPTRQDTPGTPGIAEQPVVGGTTELDLALFEAVATEEPPLKTPEFLDVKAPELQQPAVTNASHGTLVAKLEKRVKNSEKTAEIAAPIEQKMPVRDVSRRVAPEVARPESFHAEKESPRSLTADFQVEAAPEMIPLKSVDSVKLVETIRTEVTNLRQRGEATVSVVLKPDSGTQLTLEVSVARDGTIHAHARCDRGDVQNLQSQWPQLQQSLSTHGIRMADLSNQNHPHQHNQQSADSFQNFDHNQRRNQRDFPGFEDSFAAPTKQFSTTKPNPHPSPATSATRRWQSWA